MAIYPYRCSKCGREWEVIRSPLCEDTSICECGEEGKRVWTNVRVGQDTHFRAGYDWSFGRHFSSQRERDEYRARERPHYKPVDPTPKGVVIRSVK